MKVFCTGISGAGRKKYLDDFHKLCKKKDKSVRLYHVGDEIFKHAKRAGVHLTKENVLNSSSDTLSSLRCSAFESILRQMDNDESDVSVIDSHADFLWDGVFRSAFDEYYIKELNPDLFVTIIDSAFTIDKNLKRDSQWKPQKLDIKDILYWQNIEVKDTKGMANSQKKDFYAIARKQPPSTLYRLVFHPDLDKAYVSYPMSHLKDNKQREEIDRLIEFIDKHVIVFNPGTIEDAYMGTGDVKKVIDDHTVYRDIDLLINQSDIVINIMPESGELIYTSGFDEEQTEGFRTNKNVWVIFPKEPGPFTTHFSHELFKDYDSLKEYISKKYKPVDIGD